MSGNLTHKLGWNVKPENRRISLKSSDSLERDGSESLKSSSRRKYLQVTASVVKLANQNSIPSMRLTLPSESTLPSLTNLLDSKETVKKNKKTVRVNKSKPCSPPKMGSQTEQKAANPLSQAPADLLRRLKEKCKIISPIHKLHHLMDGDSTKAPRSSSKIKLVTKDIPVRQINLKR